MDVAERVCQICFKEFAHRSNLLRHSKKQHGISSEVKKILCPENLCNCSFTKYSIFRDHLSDIHKLVILKEEHIFDNLTDFFGWKERTEKETKSFFVKRGHRCLASGITKIYYGCHRSGLKRTHLSRQFNAKSRKKRNCCKMGSNCPATMEVWEEGDKIHLDYFSTHFGHQTELKYLTISKSERSRLAKKLTNGMSLDSCLNEVQSSLTNELERIHLLTKQDLRNISIAAGALQQQNKHGKDAISIAKWVKKDKESQRNLSIFIKPQGLPFLTLDEEDEVVVIMSPPQKELYQKFCETTICIDSTRATNYSNFQLTTIVIVDEFGAGFPAAFCISNRVNQCVMEIFFDAVASATTTTTPDVFMSEDVPAFYDAWKEVNGDARRKLLCPWNIERDWRKALSKIHSIEKKVNVYKVACALLEEMDVSKFKTLLKSFLQELAADDQTKNFGIHFEKVYANRPEAWARCYRLGCGINRDIYLEEMHMALEKHKKLNTCMDYLLKMVRDKIYSRLTHLVENDETSMISIIHDIIHNRHEKSLELSSAVEMVNSTTWKIRSADQASSNVHTVSKVVKDCDSCPFKCLYCDECIHRYNCTCLDYNIELNMCKHIHFVISKLLNKSEVFILEGAPVETESEVLMLEEAPVETKSEVLMLEEVPFGTESEGMMLEGTPVETKSEALMLEEAPFGTESEVLMLEESPFGTEEAPVGTKSEVLMLEGAPIGTESEVLMLEGDPIGTKSEVLMLEEALAGTESEILMLEEAHFGTESEVMMLEGVSVGTESEVLMQKETPVGTESEVLMLEGATVGTDFLMLEEAYAETEIQEAVKTLKSGTLETTTLDLQHKFVFALSLIQNNKCDTETSQKINKLMDNAINILSTFGKPKIYMQDESENESPSKKIKLSNM